MCPKDGKVYTYLKSYLPLDTIRDKAGHMAAHYQSWLEQGRLISTDGNVTDLSYIKDDVLAACELYNVREIAYDPWGGQELSADLLDKGLPMVQMSQGIGSLRDPSKELHKLIKSQRIMQGQDPLLTRMLSHDHRSTDSNAHRPVTQAP